MRSNMISQNYTASSFETHHRDECLSVGDMKSLIHGAVLIHSDCEAKPGLGIRIRRSSGCHSCHWQGRQDLAVKALAELDYDGFRVGVSGIVNKVAELVKVVVDQPFALEVSSCF